jgi:hypothetical protein
VDAVLLIVALLLVLTALAPVAPTAARRRPVGLRTRIARQLRLWDHYLAALYGREREQGW